MNEKVAPFKWYNHAPLGQISGCIKIEKKEKRYFVTDDSPFWNQIEKHIGVQLKSGEENFGRNEKDHIRFFRSEKEQIMDNLDYPISSFLRTL